MGFQWLYLTKYISRCCACSALAFVSACSLCVHKGREQTGVSGRLSSLGSGITALIFRHVFNSVVCICPTNFSHFLEEIFYILFWWRLKTPNNPTPIARDRRKRYFVLLERRTVRYDASQLLWEFIFSLASKIEPHMTHVNYST